jgi:predicted HAD superfamily Cof-like phosphohydrolase
MEIKMLKHIKNIEKFNRERGLLDRGIDIDLENSFLLSEELETLDVSSLGLDLRLNNKSHDELAKQIVIQYTKPFKNKEEEMVEYIDKVIDHFFFGVGAMLKMGLSPTQIEYLFECVENANNNKPNKSVDGKVIKDDSFVDPKEEIRRVIKTLKCFRDFKNGDIKQ